MIYIIIPLFNRIENLPRLFQNLNQQTYQNFRLILVDHGIKHPDLASLPSYVIYLRGSTDDWWSGAINIGLRYIFEESGATNDDYILLQNDDVDFGPELIEVLLVTSQQKKAVIGAVTLERGTRRVLDANNFLNFWKARHICPLRGRLLDDIKDEYLESDVLKGRGVLYPIRVARQIGYTDERLHYRADPEWSYRAKKLGWNLGITTKTTVETTLDTQEGNSDKKGLALLTHILFSKRSTQNIPAAWRYFVLCFGLIPAAYSITVHCTLTLLLFFYRQIILLK